MGKSLIASGSVRTPIVQNIMFFRSQINLSVFSLAYVFNYLGLCFPMHMKRILMSWESKAVPSKWGYLICYDLFKANEWHNAFEGCTRTVYLLWIYKIKVEYLLVHI